MIMYTEHDSKSLPNITASFWPDNRDSFAVAAVVVTVLMVSSQLQTTAVRETVVVG